MTLRQINGTWSGNNPTTGLYQSHAFIGQIDLPDPVTPMPQYFACFLCIRDGLTPGGNASTVYKGTYLCFSHVRSMPDMLIISEFPPANLGA